MKKIQYISALALAAGLTLTSCSDFLDAENKTAGGQTAEEYFSTPAGLEAWRVNTFYTLRAIATSNAIYDNSADLYWPSRGNGLDEFVQFTLSSETSAVEDLYVAGFNLVNNANGLLKYGGDTYKTDALFLRAYAYYILTQQFGAVPYSTAYINDANRDYPRVDIKTIYDGCIADLEEIYPSAPAKGADNDGTVNKRAIAALLAKINLAAAWDLETELGNAEQGTYSVTGTNYAAQAAKWAEEAISGVSLTQSFEQKWSPDNEDKNPETFFSIQYDRANTPLTDNGHGLQNDYGSYYGDISGTFQKYSGSTKVPSAKSLYLWEEGDERYQATFMTTFYNTQKGDKGVWGTEGYYAYYNATDASKANLPIAFLYAPYYTNQADFEAYLTANAARFANGSTMANAPHAYIMDNPVIAYSFDSNGKWSIDNNNGGAYNSSTLNARLNFTPSVKKWDDPETPQANLNRKNSYRDIPLLHASDLYLVAAEAYLLQNNNQECLNKINAVRTRAKAKTINSIAEYDPDYSHTFQLSLLDLLLDERARELYGEPQRYMDLRRTRQLVKYNVAFNNYVENIASMSNNEGEVKWYRPIPDTELSSNTSEGMYQNPGY